MDFLSMKLERLVGRGFLQGWVEGELNNSVLANVKFEMLIRNQNRYAG